MTRERGGETKNEDGCLTTNFKYLYDDRLVWPFEIQAQANASGNPGELGGGVFRICLSGTGKSYWNTDIHRHTTKDYTRVYNPDCVYGLCFSGFS
jgi:hypothetical protein